LCPARERQRGREREGEKVSDREGGGEKKRWSEKEKQKEERERELERWGWESTKSWWRVFFCCSQLCRSCVLRARQGKTDEEKVENRKSVQERETVIYIYMHICIKKVPYEFYTWRLKAMYA